MDDEMETADVAAGEQQGMFSKPPEAGEPIGRVISVRGSQAGRRPASGLAAIARSTNAPRSANSSVFAPAPRF